MHFRTLRRSVRTDPHDVEDFADAYSVCRAFGGHAHGRVCLNVAPAPLLYGHPVVGVVEAQIGHREQWVQLGRFPDARRDDGAPANYLTYSNQEHVWPEGIVEEAEVAHRQLRQQWGLEDVSPAPR